MELDIEIKNKLSKKIYSDMEKQFPPEEMKDFAKLNELLEKKFYKLAEFSIKNEPAGYVFFLENEYLWIDYIAVFEKFHSQGFGSKILTSLFDEYSHLKGCFFEVEPENPENIQTIKRIKFYKRLGCHTLDFEYYFQNEIKELKLDLLYKSFDGNFPNKNEIKKQVEFVFENLHNSTKTTQATLQLIKIKNQI